MKTAYLLLLAFILAAPLATAEQQNFMVSGRLSAVHSFPSDPVPFGKEFRVQGSGVAHGSGDTLVIGALTVTGCTVVSDTVDAALTDVKTWTAVLRMTSDTCHWRRLVHAQDTGLIQTTDAKWLQGGTVVAYTMTDLGQRPTAGAIDAWLPTLLLLGLMILSFFRAFISGPKWVFGFGLALFGILVLTLGPSVGAPFPFAAVIAMVAGTFTVLLVAGKFGATADMTRQD